MARKNANGEGTVAKRDDGRWEARFSYRDPVTGARRRVSAYGPTRAAARAAMAEKRGRVAEGRPTSDSRMAFGVFVERWIATTLAVSPRAESTREQYAALARRYLLAPPLGPLALAAVQPTDVEALVAKMTADGLSASTARQTFVVLSAVLSTAVRDGLIARNPAAQVDRPKTVRKEARALTPEETARLLAAVAGHRIEPYVRLLLLTGMRRGEALGLRWEEVDSDRGVVRVTGTLDRVGGRLRRGPTKTERSRRAIPMGGALRALLLEVRALQAADGRAGEEGYVFTTSAGTPLEPRNVYRAAQAVAQAADVDGFRIQTTRHTSASSMLNAGVPLKAVSNVLGHATASITADVYAHVTEAVERAGADAMEAALTPTVTPTRAATLPETT